jgi:hypothetical protein
MRYHLDFRRLDFAKVEPLADPGPKRWPNAAQLGCRHEASRSDAVAGLRREQVMRDRRLVVLVAGFILLAAAPTAVQASPRPVETRVPIAKVPGFVVTGHVRRVDFREVVNDRSLTLFPDEQTVLEIPEPTYYRAQPSAAGGPNTFEFGLETTGDRVIAASQIAYDDETGEAVLAVGVPTASSLQQLIGETAAGVSAVPTAERTRGVITPKEISYWNNGRGAFGTWWTDPVGLTVSDVITEIRWQYNGTYVRAPVVDDVTHWFAGNGWTQISHTRGQYLNAAKTVATGFTQAHHATSSWFPSPTCGTTRIKYQSNSAYGSKTGGISGGVTTWAEGSCKGLLSVQAFVFRGAV